MVVASSLAEFGALVDVDQGVSLARTPRNTYPKHETSLYVIVIARYTSFAMNKRRHLLICLAALTSIAAAPAVRLPVPADGIYEGESHLAREGNARVQRMTAFGKGWRGDHQLLWDGRVSDSTTVEFQVGETGEYEVAIQLTKAPDYGIFQVLLDGKQVAEAIDLYSARVELAPLMNVGKARLEAGIHKLAFKLTGANAQAKKFRDVGYLLGLDYVKVFNPELTGKPQKPTKPIKPLALGEIQATFQQYCMRCHGGGKEIEGKIDLRKLSTKQSILENAALASKVVEALQAREMPPEDEKQPPDEIRKRLAVQLNTWVSDHLLASAELQPIVMRRMNRYEYNNAVRDLLNLKGDIYPLPERAIRAGRPYFDPASRQFPTSVRVGNRTLGKFQVERPILTGVFPFAIDLQAEHGFNNRGDELSISPILLESFLKLGQSIVNSPQFNGYCNNYAALFEPEELPNDFTAEQTMQRNIGFARQRLKSLLERAFRQPVDDETLYRYANFFESDYHQSNSFAASMKKVVSAILASPRFLYLAEHKNVEPAKQPLNDHELAARLSFFLWSSIPDEPLLALARQGKLREPDVLRAQVRRMLLDRRSQALSENFARQWLRLDQLITAVPDFERFQVYYSRIGCEQWKFGLQTMLEPLLLFESIMVEDRSIMLLVDSDYTYRSDELQSWYETEVPFRNRGNINRFNTNQQDFKRRALKTRREGGVITTAAVMTMTSAPLRTSPIIRGSWVATAIFNRPPDPPPDMIPEIEADDAEIEAKGLTLRQRLKQHQLNQTCAACHQKIDPLGFALENYDAIGRWRDKYRSGLEIDASGKLFGEAEFKDVVSFKDAIMKQPRRFGTALTEHLLSYALGRKLTVTDKPAIDRIVSRLQADDWRFSTLVTEVATSYPFLNKTNQQEPRSEKAPPEKAKKE
jgi:hypothetical protein